MKMIQSQKQHDFCNIYSKVDLSLTLKLPSHFWDRFAKPIQGSSKLNNFFTHFNLFFAHPIPLNWDRVSVFEPKYSQYISELVIWRAITFWSIIVATGVLQSGNFCFIMFDSKTSAILYAVCIHPTKKIISHKVFDYFMRIPNTYNFSYCHLHKSRNWGLNITKREIKSWLIL